MEGDTSVCVTGSSPVFFMQERLDQLVDQNLLSYQNTFQVFPVLIKYTDGEEFGYFEIESDIFILDPAPLFLCLKDIRN